MSRTAIFQPIVTLDLDTQEVKVDWSGSLTGVEYDAPHTEPDPEDDQRVEDEEVAGPILDGILGFASSQDTALQQAQALRNLAAYMESRA